jgi:hypothetical protein
MTTETFYRLLMPLLYSLNLAATVVLDTRHLNILSDIFVRG